uniref:Uncharacterized protein n=1 Tax=Panagrolaimus sp. ES5 TaxID=591445 RepID=A0AC34FPD5_9BILA
MIKPCFEMVSSSSYLDKDEEVKKQGKKKDADSLNAVNSSTLSLHIIAYEKLIESQDADSIDEETEGLKREESDLNKKWKNVKHLFLGLPFSEIE